ncbi:hypothetical protein QMS86_13840 [Cronobacter dublinensis]|uniref:hypothetical protein n=1 Tax=Cronobacter dublinensis TaxID=413497 RepID=UPI003AE33E37
MDKSRERFEAWYQKKYCMLGDDFDRIGERYQYKTVQLMWEAWQASRAAVEIELDAKVMVEDEFDKGHNCAIDYCAEAIRAAGLKVKGE